MTNDGGGDDGGGNYDVRKEVGRMQEVDIHIRTDGWASECRKKVVSMNDNKLFGCYRGCVCVCVCVCVIAGERVRVQNRGSKELMM